MVPLRIDVALPDYFVGKEEFKQSMKLQWEVGHRFQMFFASKSKAKGRPGEHSSSQSTIQRPT